MIENPYVGCDGNCELCMGKDSLCAKKLAKIETIEDDEKLLIALKNRICSTCTKIKDCLNLNKDNS